MFQNKIFKKDNYNELLKEIQFVKLSDIKDKEIKKFILKMEKLDKKECYYNFFRVRGKIPTISDDNEIYPLAFAFLSREEFYIAIEDVNYNNNINKWKNYVLKELKKIGRGND